MGYALLLVVILAIIGIALIIKQETDKRYEKEAAERTEPERYPATAGRTGRPCRR